MNGTTTGETSKQTKTYTFSNLTKNSTYNFYAEVYDVAGNYTRTPASGTGSRRRRRPSRSGI